MTLAAIKKMTSRLTKAQKLKLVEALMEDWIAVTLRSIECMESVEHSQVNDDHRPDDLVQVRLDPRDVAEEVAGGAVLDVRLATDAAATTPVITTARAHATTPCVPSRNSTTSRCAEGSHRSRSRPAT